MAEQPCLSFSECTGKAGLIAVEVVQSREFQEAGGFETDGLLLDGLVVEFEANKIGPVDIVGVRQAGIAYVATVRNHFNEVLQSVNDVPPGLRQASS